jgi:hypothetical protein
MSLGNEGGRCRPGGVDGVGEPLEYSGRSLLTNADKLVLAGKGCGPAPPGWVDRATTVLNGSGANYLSKKRRFVSQLDACAARPYVVALWIAARFWGP